MSIVRLHRTVGVKVGPEGSLYVTDDVNGPQRLLGNHLEPMLRKSEREFPENAPNVGLFPARAVCSRVVPLVLRHP